MKKGTRIALVIGVILLAVGATIINIAVGRAKKAGVPALEGMSWSFSSAPGYDQKGCTVCTDGEESFDAAGIERLDLDWVSGSVSVEKYDGKQIVVREDIDASAKEELRMRWKIENGTLFILPCANNVRDLPEKRLTVLVPAAAKLIDADIDVSSAAVSVRDLELSGDIDVDAASGGTEISNCVCRCINIDSASGAQSVRDCECDGIRLNSASGAQSLENCAAEGTVESDRASGAFTATDLRCGALDSDGASGKLRVDGLDCAGGVNANSMSGDVYISFASVPEAVGVDTASGDVTLVFPEGTGIDLDYDTASGKLGGELKTGELPVEVDTASGDLRIEYR